MDQPREILVRAPNWTGDVIMATPALRALRQGFPEARITVHVRQGLQALLAGAPWVDEVLPVESYRGGFTAILREAWQLRRRRFDLGLCLPDSWSSALLMRIAGVRRVVGYRHDGRGCLLHVAVDPPRDAGRRRMLPRERHVLGLVEAVGCPGDDTRLELFVTPQEEAAAGAVLAEQGVGASRPWVAVAPGASYGPSKLWPARCFAAVADGLAQTGARVLLLGAPAERELVARVARAMDTVPADLSGRLDLGGLKAVMRRVRVLVCNDAGARHVAVAFGVPCIVLMGPTALEKTGLNLEGVTVLTADVDCRPCYHRVCPIDHRCMTRIDPKRVLEAALPALGESRPGGIDAGVEA